MERVLLLNYDYTFLAMISWKKAFKLLNKKKAEVLKYGDDVVRSIEETFKLPKVLKLLYFIQRIHKAHMSYSKRAVMVRDNFECGYCGSTEHLTIDHIKPKARGGKTVFDNVVTCCFSCNNKKGDKTPVEAGMKLYKKIYTPTIIEYILKQVKIKGEEFGDLLQGLME
jgi:5-methylcytosine-specific restriction endonuclease McrA